MSLLTHIIIIIIIIIIIKRDRQCKAGRAIYTLSARRLKHHNPTYRDKEEKGKTYKTKMERAA